MQRRQQKHSEGGIHLNFKGFFVCEDALGDHERNDP